MGQKQHLAADPAADPKKRRRVDLFASDSGVEAKDCIKIYLVSSKEEVGSSGSYLIEPDDLNAFFGEDGKIYGYRGLEITIWVSSISFHSYADIVFQSTSDGGKGITDLSSALKDIFAMTLMETKEEFLQTFSTQSNFIGAMVSEGEILPRMGTNGHSKVCDDHVEEAASDLEVVRLVVGKSDAGLLYSHLIPLVLLLVDGSSPIDVTDSSWELYLLIHKKTSEDGNPKTLLLGFAALYRFYHYPASSRLRMGQILVLPIYQRKGYGRFLLEALNEIAVSEDVYDLTIEEPLDYLQRLRTCIDIPRLLALESVQKEVDVAVSHVKEGKISKKTQIPRLIPPQSAIDEVQKVLKINKKQFLLCWEVLIYLGLEPTDKYIEDFVAIVSHHMKQDILGKDSDTAGKQVIQLPTEFEEEVSFVMSRFASCEAKKNAPKVDENQANQAEQLQKLVDERVNEIKLVAEKVRPNRT